MKARVTNFQFSEFQRLWLWLDKKCLKVQKHSYVYLFSVLQNQTKAIRSGLLFCSDLITTFPLNVLLVSSANWFYYFRPGIENCWKQYNHWINIKLNLLWRMRDIPAFMKRILNKWISLLAVSFQFDSYCIIFTYSDPQSILRPCKPESILVI